MTMRSKHMATSANPRRRYSVHADTNRPCLPPPAGPAASADDVSGAAFALDSPSKMPMVARAAKLK